VDVPPRLPFDTVDGAHEFVRLLAEAITDARASVTEDIAAARAQGASRRVDALQLVAFKLRKLEAHVVTSRRLLNDLRTLRRLLLDERRPE
jgi:hypothetical protein